MMFKHTINLYKTAYSGIPAPVWWLALVLLVNRSGNMVIPFLALYLKSDLHFPLEQAGMIVSCFGAGAILGALLGGRLADRIGFYPVQFGSLILNGAMFFLLGQMHTFASIAVTIFFQGVIGEAFRPANFAAVAAYSTPQSRLRAYSLIRLATNLGWTIGPALGGLLAMAGFKWLFIVDGGACIAAGVLMRFVLPPKKVIAPRDPGAVRLSGPSVYRDTPYLIFIALVLMFAVSLFQMFSTAGIFFEEELGMKKSLIGLSLAVNGLIIALFEMVLVSRLENKRPDGVYIGYGLLAMGAAYLVFNILPPVAAVAFVYSVFFSIAEMLAIPFMNNFWVHRSGEHNRGQYAALYTVAFSGAHILAPVLGTFVAERFGFTTWWYVVTGLCVVAFFGFRLLFRHVQNPARNPPQSAPSAG
ncbi:MFS transporter [Chitinophaga lutea]